MEPLEEAIKMPPVYYIEHADLDFAIQHTDEAKYAILLTGLLHFTCIYRLKCSHPTPIFLPLLFLKIVAKIIKFGVHTKTLPIDSIKNIRKAT